MAESTRYKTLEEQIKKQEGRMLELGDVVAKQNADFQKQMLELQKQVVNMQAQIFETSQRSDSKFDNLMRFLKKDKSSTEDEPNPWENTSLLPTPETGLRLIKEDKVQTGPKEYWGKSSNEHISLFPKVELPFFIGENPREWIRKCEKFFDVNQVDENQKLYLVLGVDEGKECTYGKGYLKRQEIFSCLTCTPDGTAGVCTGCSLCCHDGHEIVELWTKSKFRCDCGNSKFGEMYCKLLPNKDVENLENSYNHNFKGLYCICNRPYPDPDAEVQEAMVQCCICEDWFHEEHLGLESSDAIPRDEEGVPLCEGLICQGCSNLCAFLTLYPQKIRVTGKQQSVSNSSKEKVPENVPSPLDSKKQQDGDCSLETSARDTNSGDVFLGKGILVEETKSSNSVLLESNSAAGPSKTSCVLGKNLLESTFEEDKSETMFLCKNWREVLCRCENCSEFYKQKGISFLLDKEDSIAEYEKIGKQKRDEKLEQQQGLELNFLNKLGHVEKMEILSGIADMKSEFQSFLESFDASKPITADDVHQVFENLAKKRRRMP